MTLTKVFLFKLFNGCYAYQITVEIFHFHRAGYEVLAVQGLAHYAVCKEFASKKRNKFLDGQ